MTEPTTLTAQIEALDIYFQLAGGPALVELDAVLSLVRTHEAQAQADREKLVRELELVRGAMDADHERLRDAGLRVNLDYGCDTPNWMANAILGLRAERDALKAEVARLKGAKSVLDVFSRDEWDVIHDGLAESVGVARQNEDMWRGRARESRYKREAEEADAVRVKVEALVNALESPSE